MEELMHANLHGRGRTGRWTGAEGEPARWRGGSRAWGYCCIMLQYQGKHLGSGAGTVKRFRRVCTGDGGNATTLAGGFWGSWRSLTSLGASSPVPKVVGDVELQVKASDVDDNEDGLMRMMMMTANGGREIADDDRVTQTKTITMMPPVQESSMVCLAGKRTTEATLQPACSCEGLFCPRDGLEKLAMLGATVEFFAGATELAEDLGGLCGMRS